MQRKKTLGKRVYMKSGKWMWSTAMCLFAALVITIQLAAQNHPDHKPIIITFDAPGAGTGQFHGTFAFSINPEGAIAGTYQDPSGVYHGYLRAADGKIIESNQAACSAGAPAVSINPAETIIGFCLDANNVAHGLLRSRDGTITWFDAPGATMKSYSS